MKNKKISLMIVGGISAVIFVVFSMFIYVNYVQDSLWDKSIKKQPLRRKKPLMSI